MKFFKLLGTYTVDFVRANIDIARQVLSRNPEQNPGVLSLKTEATSPAEVLALSNLLTFTPGTLVLDVTPGEEVVIHALDLDHTSAESISNRVEGPLLDTLRP